MLPDFTKMLIDLGIPKLAAAIVLFVIGLLLLIKCGDWFVDGASGIAQKFHVPEILIGATVVSIGTTLPEVMVSATSAVSGHSQMAYGNAIGSIICNTALIAAITVAIKPSKVTRKSMIVPVCFFFAAMGYYAFNAYCYKEFSRTSGIILLAIFILYMIVLVSQAIREMKAAGKAVEATEQPVLTAEQMAEKADAEQEAKEKEKSLLACLLFLVIGAAGIAVGADLLVDNGTILATEMGVPESVVALTFVALGTSLPELVTAITSLAKGHGALSLGNIIGANLFNLVFVSGLAITLRPFAIPADMEIAGKISSLVVDVPVSILVMVVLTVPTLIRGKLSRFQGILLLAIYAAFCVYQFVAPGLL